MNNRPFVTKTYESPGEYQQRTDAPALISDVDQSVTRYNLFETAAPAHTRKYMLGLDVLGWTDKNGAERSHLIIDQKAGALVVLWEVADEDGIWIYLQETFRAPHSKDNSSIKKAIAEEAFERLGVWSLEAPAGGLSYDGDVTGESPEQAAMREVREETGITIAEEALLNLMPGGLQIGGDINTKRSYLFAANVAEAVYEQSSQAIEEDEQVGDLIAFRVRTIADIAALTKLTRVDAGTTSALALVALQPAFYTHLAPR